MNETQPFFSVIISCYNARPYIKRLLDSLIGQENKEDNEIIIVDDKSTDNFLELVNNYIDRLNIKIYTTVRDIHCPGNTREAGYVAATGQWITFIDQDDFFKPNVFKQVKDIINKNNDLKVLSTNIQMYDAKEEKPLQLISCYSSAFTWTHGKWYNHDFLLDNNIHYKADMVSHEDVFFNTQVMTALLVNNLSYYYANITTYNWVNNEASITRIATNEKYYYIEKNLDDFLVAATQCYLDIWKDNEKKYKEFLTQQIIMGLLHGYFYYQGSLARNGHQALGREALKDYFNRIIKMTDLTKENIISYVYSHPKLYDKCKQDTYSGIGEFVEKQSFKDFIINL